MSLRQFENIKYTKVGSGPHLCFLHGFCEDSRIWGSVIAHLKKEYTCIAVDIPGFGQNAHLPFGSIDSCADKIIELLNHENIDSTVLFGHSMGGYIALQMVSKNTLPIRALALIHSTASADTTAKKSNRQKTIDFVKKHGTREFFKVFEHGLVSERHYPTLKTDVHQMVSSTPASSVIQATEFMANRPSHLPTLQNFDNPVLFLIGTEDKYYEPHDIYTQAAICNTSQLSILANVGHLAMLEDPENCIREMQRFLTFVKGFAIS